MGVIYVVNLAAAKEKRLAVKRVKQCVFRRQRKTITSASQSCTRVPVDRNSFEIICSLHRVSLQYCIFNATINIRYFIHCGLPLPTSLGAARRRAGGEWGGAGGGNKCNLRFQSFLCTFRAQESISHPYEKQIEVKYHRLSVRFRTT